MDNSHIVDYLKYYYCLPSAPNYAILVKGQWGSGKTWLVKNSLEDEKCETQKDTPYIYVSLYGVESYGDIENLVFQQLHPILSSKPMRFTGQLLKGLLKASVKLDLDGDGRADGSVNGAIPDIHLPEYLSNTKDMILVFDDLERCSMNMDSILGYINIFVEHQGRKVVVIANETELSKIKEHNHDYIRVKEKLIGRTFEVTPQIGSVFSSVLNELELSDIFERNKEAIVSIFHCCEYQNLRYLKHSFMEFERFHSFLPEEAKSNIPFIDELIAIYFLLSFEIRGGSIKPDDISQVDEQRIKKLFQSDDVEHDKDVSQIDNLVDRHQNIDLSDLILSTHVWIDHFKNGIIKEDKLSESVFSSRLMITTNTPAWQHLWHYRMLRDEEFNEVRDTVLAEFQSLSYNNLEIVKHVTGIFLQLTELGIVRNSVQEISDIAFSHVDKLIHDKKIKIDIVRDSSNYYEESYSSLGYTGTNSPGYSNFHNYLETAIENERCKLAPKKANELVELLATNSFEFTQKLIISQGGSNTYYNFPILHLIDPTFFVDQVFLLEHDGIKNLSYMFASRYKHEDFKSNLSPELRWLIEIRLIIIDRNNLSRGPISSHRRELLIKSYLEPAIKLLF